MSIEGIGFNPINNDQYRKQDSGGFGGITPEFFGPPGPRDKMMDMQLCRALDIDIEGMTRDEVKANILSKLTGKPVDQMLDFYTNTGEMDAKKDMNALNSMGINPSDQPNWMMARGENKANIINGWMNQDTSQQADLQDLIQEQLTQETTNSGRKSKGPPPLPTALISIMGSIGVSPTGSKEGDYAAVMSKLDQMEQDSTDESGKMNVNNLRQSFMAIYLTL